MKIKTYLLRLIPDKIYLKLLYKKKTGKKLHLNPPVTFNEKIQWLKLYDRKPLYTVMADKYAVKKYAASKIGKKYIIPTFGVWDRFDDIDFHALPDQFVLKCTHDSGSIVIVRDKNTMDLHGIKTKLDKALKNNFYWNGREWPYKNIKPRIIAEKFMEDSLYAVPKDYKIYCLNGAPKYIAVFHDRFNDSVRPSETVYDAEWRPQHISLDNHFAVSNEISLKPECLDELLSICRKLSRGLDQVRVDFYIIGNKIYFGEITLYTAGGLQPMIPEKMDAVLGKELKLKRLKKL